MPILYVFRGLPGSGKSTAARALSAELGIVLVEPDMFCIHDGKYDYSTERWYDSLSTARSMLRGLSLGGCDIIYADVLPRKQDVLELLDSLVAPENYRLTVYDHKCTVDESLKRNKHNVRAQYIKAMAESWEDW